MNALQRAVGGDGAMGTGAVTHPGAPDRRAIRARVRRRFWHGLAVVAVIFAAKLAAEHSAIVEEARSLAYRWLTGRLTPSKDLPVVVVDVSDLARVSEPGSGRVPTLPRGPLLTLIME